MNSPAHRLLPNRRRNWIVCIGVLIFGVVGSYVSFVLSSRTDFEISHALFVFSTLRLLPVIAGVAIVAYLFRSRLMFVTGFAGVLIGPSMTRIYGGGAIHMAQANAELWQIWGIGAAAIACSTVAIFQWRSGKRQVVDAE